MHIFLTENFSCQTFFVTAQPHISTFSQPCDVDNEVEESLENLNAVAYANFDYRTLDMSLE